MISNLPFPSSHIIVNPKWGKWREQSEIDARNMDLQGANTNRMHKENLYMKQKF